MQTEALSLIITTCEAEAQAACEGAMNPLRAFADLKAAQAAIDEALSAVEPLALAEAEKYESKTFDFSGLTFTRTDGRRSFKFDHLKPWAEAKEALKRIEDAAKDAALQAEKGRLVADDGGAVCEPAIMTYGKPTLSIRR